MAEVKKVFKDFDFLVIGSFSYGRAPTFNQAFSRMINVIDPKHREIFLESKGFPRIALVPKDYEGSVSWDYNKVYDEGGAELKIVGYELPEGLSWG